MSYRDEATSLPILREQNHPSCFVCGPANRHGLGLEFRVADDGSVESCFPCPAAFAGYSGMLHGGVVCTLLDGAMTNCLFAHGLIAVTVDMNVRFRHPVAVNESATVRAWLDMNGPPLHGLGADIVQAGRVVATANARFIEKEAMVWFEKTMP